MFHTQYWSAAPADDTRRPEAVADHGTATEQLLNVSEQEVIALSRLFGLLGDPTRVRILLLLCRGEQNVSKLCAALKLPQPTVSHHLGLLRRGGLLASRREGKAIHYGLDGKLEFSETCELTIRSASGVRIRIAK